MDVPVQSAARKYLGEVVVAAVPLDNHQLVIVSQLYGQAAIDALRADADAEVVERALKRWAERHGPFNDQEIAENEKELRQIRENNARFTCGWDRTPLDWPEGWPETLWQPSPAAATNLQIAIVLLNEQATLIDGEGHGTQ